jgi:hypothetical protein
MDVRRRNALAVYWSPCSLAYAMSVVVSLEMATDARKTPPVNLQRSRIPTLIAVTSAFFCAISLLFAGSAGGKDDGFDGRPASRTCHALSTYPERLAGLSTCPGDVSCFRLSLLRRPRMFHALTLIAALILETEARLAIDAGREIAVGLASFVLCNVRLAMRRHRGAAPGLSVTSAQPVMYISA